MRSPEEPCPAMKGFETWLCFTAVAVAVLSEEPCPAMKGFETQMLDTNSNVPTFLRNPAPL